MELPTETRFTNPDIRCACGQLIARWTHHGLEIKCKRCRRLVVLPLESISGRPPRS
jgi:hypothetical protein